MDIQYVFGLFIPIYLLFQMQANPNGDEFQRTISKFKSEKKNKFRRCLFTLSTKRKIRHLHVVVAQKWQSNAKIKACKVVVLLIRPVVFLEVLVAVLSLDIRSHHVDAHARW